jgi:hypothetical protein
VGAGFFLLLVFGPLCFVLAPVSCGIWILSSKIVCCCVYSNYIDRMINQTDVIKDEKWIKKHGETVSELK